MRLAMLGAKFCKLVGTHQAKIVPTNVEEEIRFDAPVKFKFSIVDEEDFKTFNVQPIRTNATRLTIRTFRELSFKTGDKFVFKNNTYYIESISSNYYDSSQYKLVRQFFITLK